MIIEDRSITTPILTDPITINENTEVYLIYFPNAGYTLLSKYINDIFLNSVASELNPEELEQHRQNISQKASNKLKDNLENCKELKYLEEIMDKYIYQSYITNDNKPEDKSDYLNTWDTLGELIGDLEDKTLYSEEIPKITNAPTELRKYLLNTDYFYNTCNSYKNIVASKNEAKKYITFEYTKITDQINKLENKLSKYYGICKTYDLDNGRNSKLNLNEAISKGLNLNPIHNLTTAQKRNDLTNLPNFLVSEFDIKTVYEKGELNKYYYDKNKGYYDKLTVPKLQQLIKKEYELTLLVEDIKKGFNAIAGDDKKQDNIYLFENGVLDTNQLTNTNDNHTGFIEGDTRKYFTTNKIGTKQDDGSIKLLKYDTNLCLSDFLKPKSLDEDMTLTEKTLREITIPKNKPWDISLFQDYLERAGASILKKNLYKRASVYHDLGDGAKTTLKKLYDYMYNYGVKHITPATFKENFNAEDFLDKNAIFMDEVTKEFLDSGLFKNEFTSMVSQGAVKSQRRIFSSDMIHIDHYPPFTINSNHLPTVNKKERNLLTRYDILIMPNVFVSENELNKYENSYIANPHILKELEKDYEGLSWLITASILAFKDMLCDGRQYRRSQTPSETFRLLTNKPIEEEFILLYTEIDRKANKSDYVSNKEILEQFKQYMTVKGEVNNKSDNENAKQIGYILKQTYKDELKDNGRYPKAYNIKLKSFDDVIAENKQVYIINEDLTDSEVDSISWLDSDLKLIYSEIQKGINTINKLNSKYDNIDVRDCLNSLSNANLIKNTFNTSVD